jgi:hypothetical protein
VTLALQFQFRLRLLAMHLVRCVSVKLCQPDRDPVVSRSRLVKRFTKLLREITCTSYSSAPDNAGVNTPHFTTVEL